MSEVLTPLVYQLGVGGIGGFIVGYAFKKIVKVVVVLLGLLIFVLLYLGYVGIIAINYDKMAEATQGLLGATGPATEIIILLVSHIPFEASFVIGLILGFKKG